MPLPEAARYELNGLANRVLDVPSYFAAAGRVIGRMVPYDGVCWFTLDPATALPTSHVSERSIPPEKVPRLAQNEYGEHDVNKFATLARRQRPSASLLVATRQDPETSIRYREVLHPYGIRDELRTALVVDGLAWGGLALYRRRAEPFTSSEVSTLAIASAHIAEGLRRSVLTTSAGDDEEGPGLLVVGADGRVVTRNRAAKRWLDGILTLPPPSDAAPLPDVVHALVTRARTGDGIARARMPLLDGGWVTVHASLVDDTGDDVALIFEPSRPVELAAIIVAAYGLTARERDVAALLLRGFSTKHIAAALHLSAYTVQDHIKSVLESARVASSSLACSLISTQAASQTGPTFAPTAGFASSSLHPYTTTLKGRADRASRAPGQRGSDAFIGRSPSF